MIKSRVWRFFKTLKTELQCDLIIPLLGIYPEENTFQKDMKKRIYAPQYYCSTNYNSQDIQEPNYPLTEEGIKKMWYIYTMEY